MQITSKIRFYFLFLGFLLLGSTSLQADTNFVTNLNTGSKYRDLQQAIDIASNGDTLKLYGAFYGSFKITGKSLYITGPSELNQFATLNGDGNKRVLEIIGAPPAAGATNSMTVNLINLIIQNGLDDHGGGIYSANAQLNLYTVFVINNKARNNGGGIACFNSNLQIVNSTINYNQASSAGGIDNLYGNMSITNSDVSYNTATQFGGGAVVLMAGTNSIQQSTLIGNRAAYGGGILNEINTSTSLYQCVIRENNAARGGAFYNNSALTVNQSSISQNTASDHGGALYNTSDAILARLIGSGISFNTANTQDSNSGGGIFNAGTDANIELDYINLVLNWPDNMAPRAD